MGEREGERERGRERESGREGGSGGEIEVAKSSSCTKLKMKSTFTEICVILLAYTFYIFHYYYKTSISRLVLILLVGGLTTCNKRCYLVRS